MKKALKMAVATAIIMMVSVNLYKVYNVRTLSESVLANVEALASVEYDGLCVEWVDKNCWRGDQFSTSHGTDYYATCSGESTSGGKRECGAVSSYLPLYPYNPGICLQCVATVNGAI